MRAWCEGDELYVELTDGRVVSRSLPEFVRDLPPAERRCVVDDFGTAICWPAIDECVGVNWLFGVSEDVIDDLAGFEKGPFRDER